MIDNPTLLALKHRLREGRARMPSQTSESAYAQQARSLSGTRGTTSAPPEPSATKGDASAPTTPPSD